MIKINFEDTYDPIEVANDFSFMTFNSEVKANGATLLKIIIKSVGDPLLPNVFNLSFGPPVGDDAIDDQAEIPHQNLTKVFSTILLFGFTYLQNNPLITIGVDGSNDVRAYLYHRMFITNKEYLKEYFASLGVDWYVRLLRNGDIELDDKSMPFFKPKPEPFDYDRNTSNLYRYYMFHLEK
ncbi:MAG: hypothetical protein JWQ30_1541 [Sediminibacterium sp.]|nr:hypothetical protein [Sediminibacterium sp.]